LGKSFPLVACVLYSFGFESDLMLLEQELLNRALNKVAHSVALIIMTGYSKNQLTHLTAKKASLRQIIYKIWDQKISFKRNRLRNLVAHRLMRQVFDPGPGIA
jgi:serine phosphatase RsbU (regulator of sigma subunit)